MDEIKDKIKKLLALSKSSNENEAALAAQRAQELLEKYNLSIDTVMNEIIEKHIEFGRETRWKTILLNSCAETYFTKLVCITNGKAVKSYAVYGKAHNIEITISIYEWLMKVINRICSEKCKRMRTYKSRNSFRLGMAYSIAAKLTQKRSGTSSAKSETGLIEDIYETERKAIEEYCGTFSTFKSKPKQTSAFQKGLSAGENVNLNDQLSGSSRKRDLIA